MTAGETSREKKNRRVAFVISFTLHSTIVLILFFLAAWKAPDPPLPDYGIELNFGMDAAGSGTEQSTSEVAEQPAEEVTPQQQTETTAETQSEPTPEPEAPPIESQVTVKPSKPEVKKPEPKPEPEKKIEKEVVKTPEPKKPEADPKALFKPQPEVRPVNNGDSPNAVGDQGVKEGKIDAKALYGTPGGGGGGAGGSGSGLDLAGWRWDREPSVTLPPTEKNGRLVFEIEVDDNGDIIKLVPIERGLSPAAEKLCREEILKRKFTPLGDRVPPVSKGRVTFVVKAH